MLDRVKLRIQNIDEDWVVVHFKCTMSPIGENFDFEYSNFRGTYVAAGRHVELHGSLHKFFKDGENFDDFTYREALLSLVKIAREFYKELRDIEIRYVEIGVNLIMSSNPSNYFNCFISLGRNSFIHMTPLTGTSKINGKRCKSSTTDFKVYNKSADVKKKSVKKATPPANLVRIEIALSSNYLRQNKMFYNAEQLLNIRIFRKYVRALVNSFKRSNKAGSHSAEDLKGMSEKDMRDYFFITSDKYDLYIQCLKDSGLSLKNEIARCKKTLERVSALEIKTDDVEELTEAFDKKRKELMTDK